MKQLPLLLTLIMLISTPLAAHATGTQPDNAVSTYKTDTNKPIAPPPPKASDQKQDNQNTGMQYIDEYPDWNGNNSKNQPIDKSSLPPS